MYWITSLSHQLIYFFPDGSGICQDDNTKINRALVVKEWRMSSVREHEEAFSHINWSPQSPDFNLIESILG